MITRITDILALLTLLGALTLAYRPRRHPAVTAAGAVLCLLGAQGQILLEERIRTLHFLLYILAFLIWGCVYAHFFLRGLFWEKTVMVVVYVSSFFFFSDISIFLRALLLPAADVNWRFFRIVGILFCGWYLYRNAIHTSRKVPLSYRVSVVAVMLLFLAAYYAMHHNHTPDTQIRSGTVSLLLLSCMLVSFYLCGSLIRYYESGLHRVAARRSGEAEQGMVQESMRLNRRLRMYRHESANHAAALSALLDRGDVEAARHMLAEIQACADAGDGAIHTGNPVADAVLNQKAAEAEAKGIPMRIDACLDSVLPLTDMELTSLLSNLLNNALEASMHVKDPGIDVQIYPTRAYLCVSVRNRADLSSLSDNPLLASTKKDPDLHGFGLRVVREIADRYSGTAVFQVERETESFAARVSLLVNP